MVGSCWQWFAVVVLSAWVWADEAVQLALDAIGAVAVADVPEAALGTPVGMHAGLLELADVNQGTSSIAMAFLAPAVIPLRLPKALRSFSEGGHGSDLAEVLRRMVCPRLGECDLAHAWLDGCAVAAYGGLGGWCWRCCDRVKCSRVSARDAVRTRNDFNAHFRGAFSGR